MICTQPTRPIWGAVGAATMLLLAACGSDGSAAEDTSSASATQQSTTEVTSAPATTAAPEPPTTPEPTSLPSTPVASEPTNPEVPVDVWATDVVAVYDQLWAAQVENAVEFVTWIETEDGSEPNYANEVDAYLVLTSADAADVAAAIDQLPTSRSDDADLAGPYDAFVGALTAEADGAAELSEQIDQNLDAFRAEAVEAQVTPPPPSGPLEGSFDEVRADFTNLQDDVTSACFELQAALTARDLALINCTGS